MPFEGTYRWWHVHDAFLTDGPIDADLGPFMYRDPSCIKDSTPCSTRSREVDLSRHHLIHLTRIFVRHSKPYCTNTVHC